MEYGINIKPSTLVNPIYNEILKYIHQVLVNLVPTCNITQTYDAKDDPWSGILAAAAYVIFPTTNRLKFYIPGQLVFGHGVILPIKYKVDWELTRHQKQTQLNKDNISKNRKRVDHAYKVGDKVMLNNIAA